MRLRLALMACLLPVAVQAQEPLPDRLAACARQTNPEERLRCFEGLTAVQPPAAAAPAQSSNRVEVLRGADGKITGAGEWSVFRDVDSMTDRARVTLVNVGVMEVGQTRNDPSVHIRCFNQRLEAFVAFNAYLSNQQVAVRFRFDQRDAVSQSWSASTSGTSVFAPDGRSFTDRAVQAQRLIIEASTFRGERYRASFDLTGIEQVLPEIAACRQPPRPQGQGQGQGQRPAPR